MRLINIWIGNMWIQVNGLGIVIWPFAFFVLFALLLILWRKRYSLSYLLCVFVFGIYLIFVLDKVFFPLYIESSLYDVMRQPFLSDLNIIPFTFGRFGTLAGSLSTLFLNVILTIPFGFGISFVVPIKARDFFWLPFALGFGIELTQLAINLLPTNYPHRIVDINDVLMNALGVLIGYAIFRIFAFLYVWLTQRFSIAHRGLSAFIYEICNRV